MSERKMRLLAEHLLQLTSLPNYSAQKIGLFTKMQPYTLWYFSCYKISAETRGGEQLEQS